MKLNVAVMVLAMLLAAQLMCFAQQENMEGMQEGQMPMKEGMSCMMMRQGKSRMCPMHMTMMKMVTSRTLTCTQDGGVVVMVGNRLYKYDSGLVLRQEAVVDLHLDEMEETVKKMMEKCPMCQKMGSQHEMMQK